MGIMIALSEKHKVGEKTYINRNPLTQENFVKQPVLILRVVSRQDFIDFHMENNREAFENGVAIGGLPPWDLYYYEVSTD